LKVADLFAVTKLASRISNASSLTPLYRSIELSKEMLRCCSEFGNLSIAVSDTGLTSPVLLDGTAVLAITNSLPGDAEITLAPQENKVNWKCGNVKGTLNIVFSEHSIPELNHENYPWTPSADLANALVLASSAVAASAVSIGLYGIQLEVDNETLWLISSNSVSLASVKIPKGSFPVDKITIRPPVPGVLATFLTTCPNCVVDITEQGIFVQGDWLKAHLPVSIPLEHDLKKIVAEYPLATQTALINNAAVKLFVNRARALSDKNAFFTVGICIEEGKLILRHASIASTTEEVFLCENLDEKLTYPLASLPADLLAVSLGHVKTAVFDYLGTSRLILKGDNPDFTYIISGGAD